MTKSTSFSTLVEPITLAVARRLAFLSGSAVRRDTSVAEVPAATTEPFQRAPEFLSIAIINSKGGAGKSTSAINVAAAAHFAGERAAIVDCDLRQHTAFDWWSVRGRAPRVVQVGAEKIPRAIQAARTHGITFLLVDTPGHDSLAATAVISQVDFVLVPVPPTWADFQATLPLLTRLRRETTPCAVLLTRVHKARTARNEKFRAALAAKAPVLDAVIPNREIFSDAAGAGITVFDVADAGARESARDVAAVYRELRLFVERLHHG